MTTFEQIENGFFKIDENDNSSIVKYFRDNQDYFISIDIIDKEKSQKDLWMLSEILNAAYKVKDYGLVKLILKSTLDKFKKYSDDFNYDLSNDTFYRSLIYNVAIDNFNRSNYFIAKKYFKISVQLNKEDFRLNDFLNESKYRFLKRLSNILGAIGFTLLALRYILKLGFGLNGLWIIFTGYIAIAIVMIYLIVDFTNKKPSHQQRV